MEITKIVKLYRFTKIVCSLRVCMSKLRYKFYNPKKELGVEMNFNDQKIDVPTKEKYVSLVNVNKVYDGNVHAVIDFNLDIKEKEFIVFVGPSGCGKSTTLRMIAGLENISSGDLYINEVYSNHLSPKDRDIAMVFQSYALYPNMTVYDNMAFGLKVRHVPKAEIQQKVMKAAETLELTEYLKRKPKALSGGQRQRVALGRALVRDAQLFLMDEPLSNLDAKLRVQMRSEIIKLHQQMGATTIYVTHDQTEAMTMADRIVVMRNGYVQQIGTPREIYSHPANKFVAAFIGSPAMNIVPAKYDNGKLIFTDGTLFTLPKDIVKKHDEFYAAELAKEKLGYNDFVANRKAEVEGKSNKKVTYVFDEANDEVVAKKNAHIARLEEVNSTKKHDILFGIRPEAIVETTASDKKGIDITVTLSELLGDEYYVHFNYGGCHLLSKIDSEEAIEQGQQLRLKIKEDKIHLFDYETELAVC